MIEMSKDKNFIKQRIKKLCLTNNKIVPNFDYASLCDRVQVTGGYGVGELGLIMAPPGYINTNPCLEVMLDDLPSRGRFNTTIPRYTNITSNGLEPLFGSYRRRGYLYDDGSVNYQEVSYNDLLENNDYEF
jgi:hypothetical protein